jgi:hypothetical protein
LPFYVAGDPWPECSPLTGAHGFPFKSPSSLPPVCASDGGLARGRVTGELFSRDEARAGGRDCIRPVLAVTGPFCEPMFLLSLVTSYCVPDTTDQTLCQIRAFLSLTLFILLFIFLQSRAPKVRLRNACRSPLFPWGGGVPEHRASTCSVFCYAQTRHVILFNPWKPDRATPRRGMLCLQCVFAIDVREGLR